MVTAGSKNRKSVWSAGRVKNPLYSIPIDRIVTRSSTTPSTAHTEVTHDKGIVFDRCIYTVIEVPGAKYWCLVLIEFMNLSSW